MPDPKIYFGITEEDQVEFDLFFPLWSKAHPWWTPSNSEYTRVNNAFYGWKLARGSWGTLIEKDTSIRGNCR